ncbi:MAG: hypothetical protein Q7K28_02855 [Candidatus Wildermuthbacteria bacterium]|nr:hypothetical protein [Candidatus Wildermuthbacteria bacterium]
MQKPFIIVIILAIILAVGGGVYFLVKKGPVGGGAKGIEKSLEELKVEALNLDISLSPLPKLNVSSFNLSFPQLPSGNIFPSFSVDADFSYNKDINISSPSVKINAPVIPSIPGQQSVQPPSGPTINAATCSQFSAIPSGYCSMAGASGQTLCEQCKTGGF